MGRLLVLWIVLGMWVTASVYIHVAYIKRIGFAPDPVLPAVHVIDGPRLRVKLPGSLFHKAESTLKQLEKPSTLDTLATYLINHPRRLLTVVGYHTPAENKLTLMPNLGLMRADEVRQYLLNAGVSEDQVQIQGQASDLLSFIKDSTSALSFSFQSIVINADWLARHQKYTDLFHPLQLYFPTGSTEYIVTPDNEQFVREAITYLYDHQTERLTITGHTDSTGTEAFNLKLSRLRAMVVRDKLIQQGASKRWLQVVAMGDKVPIAPNNLTEGREANRRVTLLVKKR
ncbi:OmpA family protein [Spirosoma fluviale]|uniref:OmpA-OmpF porin, OOP family n=1 Tax=Spirosoma fluviale TaxID=1597977 RepID=A0A286G3P0_9BACT|nr:OmpA family protein [Spirosoma fluviale]SOD90102.1 OmpA-OmpF porin, OOP family [Spirosoma fluviale]